MRVWIDVDNPPQVQYLAPLRAAFEAAGAEVVTTARDYQVTLDLLRQRGERFHAFGAHFGRSKHRKALGVLGRTVALSRFFGRRGRPDVLVSSSRSSALAARRFGIPAFIVCDYEWVDLRLYRLARSRIVHPDVIPAERFLEQGFAPDRLVPLRGLKEDISFGSTRLEDVEPADLRAPDDGRTRVLVRPPAEESHYFESAGRELTQATLAHLASREDVRTVFSPRYPWQSRYLEEIAWQVEPVVLVRPLPFLSLLRAVDVVVAAGGTMVREAAYVGRPAYSLLPNRIGGVDAHLESLGRLTFVRSREDVRRIDGVPRRLDPLPRNERMTHDLVETVMRTGGRNVP